MTQHRSVTLRAEAVRFFSEGDEAAFFGWLARLASVLTARGEGDTILLDVDRSRLESAHLRELIALFHRYQVDMRQLRVFEGRGNRTWLRDERAYWHAAMYETAAA